MRIKNGLVFQENGTFQKQDIYTLHGRIVTRADWEATDDAATVDAEGLFVIPGLIDVHSHGAVGCDFSDADTEGLKKILTYEYAHGITSYCPTSMTLPLEQLKEIFASGISSEFSYIDPKDEACSDNASEPFSGPYARIAGFHMEGPFLDPVKKGAHQECYIHRPDSSFFRECQEAAKGHIRLVTMAPNMEGTAEFIDECADETVLSLGHTSCDYETARRAIRSGVHHMTHLYNAMPEILHRDPGPIGAAIDEPECMVELIADGIHSHDAMIRNAFALFGDRIVLISDSLRAAGLGDGTCDLGGQTVTVRGPLATLADGTIAGSVSNLYDNMCHAIAIGVKKEAAILAATANPAKSIGIYDTVGSITPGKLADLLLVDENMKLIRVLGGY